jgi:hypothetical protein
LLRGAEESRAEFVEGDSKHHSSLELVKLVYVDEGWPRIRRRVRRLVLAGCGVVGSLFRVFEGFRGVLVGLFGELVSGEMIAFAVRSCCGLVGVGCFVVIFGGAVVRALRHDVLLDCWMRVRVRAEQMLSAHPAAVHGEDSAGDVVAGGRAEVESGAGDVFGLAPACGGNALEDLAVAGLIGLEGFGVGGGEVAGCDGVDLDAFGSPLVGEGLGELGYSAFAGGVGGNSDAALKAQEGGDVDDFAAVCAKAAAWDHVAGGELGELKDTGEIDLKDLLPVLEGDLFGSGAKNGSGVVDEDVDAAESFFELGEEIFGAVGGGEIGAKGCGVLAYGFGGFSRGAAVAMAGDCGSCLRECDGYSCAETAG